MFLIFPLYAAASDAAVGIYGNPFPIGTEYSVNLL